MGRKGEFPLAPLLSDQAFKYLKQQILDGELKEGERLNEKSLQEFFGTSRSPIREAFRRLEMEGLVEVIPRRGTYVRQISHKDLKEATEVRAALERLAVQLVAANPSQRFLTRLRNLVDKMDEKLSNGEIEEFTILNYRFHRLIVEASKNQTLLRVHAIVTEPFVNNNLTYIYVRQLKDLKDKEHRKLCDLLESGNVKIACDFVERHAKSLLEALEPDS